MFGITDAGYAAQVDVIDEAIAELRTALSGFSYGDITLYVFQGRWAGDSFSDTASSPPPFGWGLPTPSTPPTASGGAWVAYRFSFPRGSTADLDPLWQTVESVRAAIRGLVPTDGSPTKDGTGTYIGETVRDSLNELRRMVDAQTAASGGLVPFGFVARVFLVTDSDENVWPGHEAGQEAVWETVQSDLQALYTQLGYQLVIDQLYWGPVCPAGLVAEYLGPFNYRCVPHPLGAQRATVVPFPSTFRIDFNCAMAQEVSVPFLSLCPDAPLPPGRVVMAVDAVYLCRTIGVQPPLRRDDPAWIDLGSRGIHVGLASAVGEPPRPQILVPVTGVPGQFSPVPLVLSVPQKELASLVREVYPAGVDGQIAIVARLRLAFDPDAPGSQVVFTDDVVSAHFFYEPSALQIDVGRDPGRLDAGTLQVRVNAPAMASAIASGLDPRIRLIYDPRDIKFFGLDANQSVTLPKQLDEPFPIHFSILRPEGTSGGRSISVTLDFSGLLSRTVSLAVADVAILPEPGGSPITLDAHPYVDEGSASLMCPLEFQVACGTDVVLGVSLVKRQLPTKLSATLGDGYKSWMCGAATASWSVPVRVDFEAGEEALRETNRTAIDLELQFSAATEDPGLFITVPQGLVPIDLQYSENQIRAEIEKQSGLSATSLLVPGDVVATVVVRCTSDVREEDRAAIITLDPRLLAFASSKGVQDLGGGRYVITSSSSPDATAGRFTLHVAASVWDCPVVSGPQAAVIGISSATTGPKSAIPNERERTLAFSVAQRPSLMPIVVPDPEAEASRWLDLRSSGKVASVSYDLTDSPSADIELRVTARSKGGERLDKEFFIVEEDDDGRGTFSVETVRAPYGATGVLEFAAVDAVCGLAVEAPSTMAFSIETVWPLLLWIGTLALLGLSVAAVAAFIVYAKLESYTLFDALEYLWGFERWTVLVGASVFAATIAMMLAFVAVR